jgi:DNA repair protein RadD
MKYEDRWYQIECKDAWLKDILAENCNPIVAVPTAGGKTVILGLTIRDYLKEHPDNKVLVLSHTSLILEQDKLALEEFFPDKYIGMYSAGLESRETEQITVAGIQSVYKKTDLFKWYNLIIVDEVHTVGHKNTGMYRTFFKDSMAVIAGMSATIFRSGHGYIHHGEGTLFNKLSYDLSSKENFNRLVKEGYLCNLRTIEPKTKLDSRNVKKTADDYNVKDLARAHDREHITRAAIKDAVVHGKGYKKWLVFAIDIDHADNVAKALNRNGVRAASLHSRSLTDPDKIIEAFRSGPLTALVSVGMITTGFNCPTVDLILMLRPTLSALLHVQMDGRGLRPHPDKDHTLVLDYCGNTELLGPINDVTIPTKTKKRGGYVAPRTKTCPKCRTINAAAAKECEFCQYEWVRKVKIKTVVSTAAVIVTEEVPKVRWLNVKLTTYRVMTKPHTPSMLQVTYMCGLQAIKEVWCLDHPGYAGKLAAHKAGYRGYMGQVTTAAVYAGRDKLRAPKRILVDFHGQYPNIDNYQF